MKILVSLNKKSIPDYLNYTNSFIIGLKDFSINYLEYTCEEIKNLREEYPDIEIFVSVNKNIFNSDLKKLEEILIELDKIKISGVLFYDLSILSLAKKNHLSFPLIWGQEHMTTNYNTCNYYYDKGCQYVFLSNEITKDEIKEIKKYSEIMLMSFFYGYPEVSFSKRKLLTNYFLHYNEKKANDTYTIASDDEKYFIRENNHGTRILYGKVLNGVKPFDELRDDVDYAVLSEDMMEHEVFLEGLKVFSELLSKKINVSDAFERISELNDSDNTNFYYKRTIYKVKDENKN